jgi:hypothetical protein
MCNDLLPCNGVIVINVIVFCEVDRGFDPWLGQFVGKELEQRRVCFGKCDIQEQRFVVQIVLHTQLIQSISCK